MKRRWVMLIGALAAVSACRSTPEPLSVSLSTSSSALAVAVTVAEEIDDPVQRSDVLVTVAEGYLSVQNLEDALQVAEEVARLVDGTPVTSDVVPLQLKTAELLLACGVADGAHALIVETVNFVAALRDEPARAELLPQVIRTAIYGGDETRDLLPAAVDPVYVIEDTGLRARTFIEIAGSYLAVGLGQSVTGLIQQAIPAIRSTADPFRRAFLFGELSSRASAAGQADLARSLAEDAEEELLLGIGTALPDVITVQSVYRSVARELGVAPAIASARSLGNPSSSGSAYVAIASVANERPAVAEALGLAAGSAEGIEDGSAYATLMTQIALEYLAAGLRIQAEAAADLAATRVWGEAAVPVATETQIQLARVHALLDQSDLLREYLSKTAQPYVRGLLSVSAAEALIDAGLEGVADDFLVDALLASDESGFLADDLRVDIVEGFSRSGNYGLAIRTVERIEDPVGRARAVASLGFHSEANGGISREQLTDLRNTLGLPE